MASVNKVVLIGHLGKDPDVRSFPSGGKYVLFSLATSESWQDKRTGERQQKTEWHNISITNERLAEIAERYLKKGSKVYLEGQLHTRKWTDNSGIERYTTDVVLPRFRGELVLLDGKNNSSSEAETSYSSYQAPSTSYQPNASASHSEADREPSWTAELNDDVPF